MMFAHPLAWRVATRLLSILTGGSNRMLLNVSGLTSRASRRISFPILGTSDNLAKSGTSTDLSLQSQI